MTSILKNQIIKHLSKFARNLNPDKISLDVLKGKSKLEFIELNEEVLTDVLELPPWLRIKQAFCVGVTVSVPWTKLKSAPVVIFIDEINVNVVLTSEPPQKKPGRPASALSDNTSYGFADKVIEGLSLYINTVEISFDSDAFGGSFMLSRLSVESRTPGWQVSQDLRQTRINCSAINRALIFKQISWHLLRIEASAKTSRDEKRCTVNAPLRLITSGGKIRLTLKKNTIDGTVENAQIQMLLDDILWVATLPQLRSAILFSSYLMSLVRQSEKEYPPVATLSTKPSEAITPNGQAITISNTFRTFDFQQTSHHLHIKKVDLHLCDDAHSSITYPPGWNIESGAMQVTLYRVLIDIYPRTLVSSDRRNWPRYSAPNDFTRWLETRLAKQFSSFCAEMDEAGRTRLVRCWPQLMSFNVVLRIYDLIIQCVSDANSKRDSLQNMFTSDRHTRSLPNDQYIVHFEFANFIHPMSNSLPVPSPASFLQLGPFSILFDKRTLRWSLYIAHNLATAFDQSVDIGMEPVPHSDIRIDLLMPKVIVPFPCPSSNDRRFPLRLLISFSTLSLSNTQFDRDVFKPFEMLNKATISYVGNSELLGGRSTLVEDLAQLVGAENPSGGEVLWLRTSPAWVDTDHGVNTKSLPVISDVCFSGVILVKAEQMNIYVEPTTQINAVVDHFQFIQLMKLSASLSQFFDILAEDQKHFDSERSVPSLTVVVLIAIKQARANILLTMGTMPSPYDSCPAVAESILECLSVAPEQSRNNTPRGTPTPLPTDLLKSTPTRAVDPFPEFKAVVDYDACSFVDDSTSIATSTEDESNFEMDVVPEEDDLDLADLAEDAAAIDDSIICDRIYKVLMAKHGNILIVDLMTIITMINVHNKDTLVLGKANNVLVSQKLDVARTEAYDGLRKKSNSMENIRAKDPEVVFTVIAPAGSNNTNVQITVKGLSAQLDDEIVSHLAAFSLQEDDETENNVNLVINVCDSSIVINDRNKKKPLRLKIKECVIEQDNGDDEH